MDWDGGELDPSAQVTDTDGARHHTEAVLTEYEEDAVFPPLPDPGAGGAVATASSRCDCSRARHACIVGAPLY